MNNKILKIAKVFKQIANYWLILTAIYSVFTFILYIWLEVGIFNKYNVSWFLIRPNLFILSLSIFTSIKYWITFCTGVLTGYLIQISWLSAYRAMAIKYVLCVWRNILFSFFVRKDTYKLKFDSDFLNSTIIVICLLNPFIAIFPAAYSLTVINNFMLPIFIFGISFYFVCYGLKRFMIMIQNSIKYSFIPLPDDYIYFRPIKFTFIRELIIISLFLSLCFLIVFLPVYLPINYGSKAYKTLSSAISSLLREPYKGLTNSNLLVFKDKFTNEECLVIRVYNEEGICTGTNINSESKITDKIEFDGSVKIINLSESKDYKLTKFIP